MEKLRSPFTLVFAFVFGIFASPALAQAVPTDPDLAAFLAQVLRVAQEIGGLSKIAQISAVITLLVSSIKVTALRQIVWDRLGFAKVWLAPALGLLAGILGLGAAGAPVTLPLVLLYVTAGGGAVFLHELLDAFKDVPGLGQAYQRAVERIGRAMGSKAHADLGF